MESPRASLLMHPDEVKEFSRKRESLVHQLNIKKREFLPDGRYYINPPTDRDSIKKKIADIDHSLAILAPKSTTSQQRDAMWKEAKRLIEEVREGMPTAYEMHPMQLNPQTGVISKDLETLERSVKKHMAWEAKNKQKIIRLKNITRTLGEPEVGNVERLRPKGTSTGRYLVK